MAAYITESLGTGANTLVDAVSKSIGSGAPSAEEKKEHDIELSKAATQYDLEMARIGLQSRQLDLADVSSARENQIRIQEAEHASWLSKNVHSILSIIILLLTFFMYWYIVSGNAAQGFMAQGSPMKDIVIYILGALTAVATQVVSYFFGSSSGSADKSRAINAIARK
jgi:hypothetical protein